MATFKIFGASKETAEDVEIIIDATDFREAEQKANKMGIYVSRVEPATPLQSTTSVANAPPPTLEPATPRDALRKILHSGCPACGGDKLVKQKVYRLSGPAVVIGYILLIPSFVGIALNAIFLLILGLGTAGSATSSRALQETMMQNDPTLDPELAEGVANTFAGAACCMGGLIGVGPVVGIILCFVGGLIGWILIMQKKVMVCRNCKTIVSTVV